MAANEFNNGIDPTAIFSKGSAGWTTSKEEAWEKIASSLDTRDEKGGRFIRSTWYLAAAAIIIAVISSFLAFYTKSYRTTPGQVSEITLPDGSEIKLSYNSEVSFNPITWNYSRKIKFKGEAFFSVKEGKKFMVISDQGKTEVLGTTFNILSTGSIYEVTCFTGKVKVSGRTGINATLTGNQKATFMGGNPPEIEMIENRDETTGWFTGEFYFTSDPLGYVLEKVALIFGSPIDLQAQGDFQYTGNFSRENDIEDVLDIVCNPFGLKYEKTGKGFVVR